MLRKILPAIDKKVVESKNDPKWASATTLITSSQETNTETKVEDPSTILIRINPEAKSQSEDYQIAGSYKAEGPNMTMDPNYISGTDSDLNAHSFTSSRSRNSKSSRRPKQSSNHRSYRQASQGSSPRSSSRSSHNSQMSPNRYHNLSIEDFSLWNL